MGRILPKKSLPLKLILNWGEGFEAPNTLRARAGERAKAGASARAAVRAKARAGGRARAGANAGATARAGAGAGARDAAEAGAKASAGEEPEQEQEHDPSKVVRSRDKNAPLMVKHFPSFYWGGPPRLILGGSRVYLQRFLSSDVKCV